MISNKPATNRPYTEPVCITFESVEGSIICSSPFAEGASTESYTPVEFTW